MSLIRSHSMGCPQSKKPPAEDLIEKRSRKESMVSRIMYQNRPEFKEEYKGIILETWKIVAADIAKVGVVTFLSVSNNQSYYQSVRLKYSDGFELNTILDVATINRLSTEEGSVLMEEIRKNSMEASDGGTGLDNEETTQRNAGRPPTDYKVWTDMETKALFEIRSNMEDEFNRAKTHTTLWNRISKNMNEQGIEVTSENCKTKWKALKQQYRKTVDHNNQTGAEPKTCKFIKEFDQLYGNRSGTKPIATNASMIPVQNAGEDEADTDMTDHPKSGKKRKIRSPVKSPTMKWLNSYQKDTATWREQQAARQDKQHEDRMAMLGKFLKALEKQ